MWLVHVDVCSMILVILTENAPSRKTFFPIAFLEVRIRLIERLTIVMTNVQSLQTGRCTRVSSLRPGQPL